LKHDFFFGHSCFAPNRCPLATRSKPCGLLGPCAHGPTRSSCISKHEISSCPFALQRWVVEWPACSARVCLLRTVSNLHSFRPMPPTPPTHSNISPMSRTHTCLSCNALFRLRGLHAILICWAYRMQRECCLMRTRLTTELIFACEHCAALCHHASEWLGQHLVRPSEQTPNLLVPCQTQTTQHQQHHLSVRCQQRQCSRCLHQRPSWAGRLSKGLMFFERRSEHSATLAHSLA
jgi:hypothetical protein